MVFPVVMYGCESWTVTKAGCRIVDAFELWCWRRLLRVPWTSRRSNHSILKEIIPGCSLERLMLKLKLQYFGHLLRRADPDAGKDWGQEEKGVTEDEVVGWHHQFNGHEFGRTPGDSERQGILACCSPWGCRVRHDLATEQQQQQSTFRNLQVWTMCASSRPASVVDFFINSAHTYWAPAMWQALN